MAREYEVISDTKLNLANFKSLYNDLKNSLFFDTAIFTKFGISMADKLHSEWESVGIELTENGLLVTEILGYEERNVLFELIRKNMENQGIGVIIKEE